MGEGQGTGGIFGRDDRAVKCGIEKSSIGLGVELEIENGMLMVVLGVRGVGMEVPKWGGRFSSAGGGVWVNPLQSGGSQTQTHFPGFANALVETPGLSGAVPCPVALARYTEPSWPCETRGTNRLFFTLKRVACTHPFCNCNNCSNSRLVGCVSFGVPSGFAST
ncbi:hypothetical protein M0804_010910 [Polistes exclamans]|nr:hypothetical protein M0804_010910 [Polistes exclamans]